MTYENMTEDVKKFLDDKDLEKIILVGHSMGGKTAMHFALNFPDRILALIVVDIAPTKYNNYEELHEIVKSMEEIRLTSKLSRSEIAKQLTQKIKDKNLASFLMTNLIIHKKKFKWRSGLAGIKANIRELLIFPSQGNFFLGPTKFIKGENSDYINFDNRKLIRNFFPKSRVTCLKKCGHWLHFEQPQDFKDLVEEFLQKYGLA